MSPESTALLTDKYELTMLNAALGDGTADRDCVFEVFARRLPDGRRYGMVAGTARVLDAIAAFRFAPAQLDVVSTFLDEKTVAWLADYRFTGDVDGYLEGDVYFPGSPVLTVRGSFAQCVILETVILSILNHDSAIAAAAARMVSAAGGRTLIDMGSRRTHEDAAIAAARASFIAGFDATSNLAAHERYGIAALGTSAHAFTLAHAQQDGASAAERRAFAAQVDTFGPGTTLLVDTFDISEGVRNAVAVAGPELGAVRVDSGDLGVLARQVRDQLDSLGAVNTKIVVSGDLDEHAIAALRSEPVDVYGVGTSLVIGSGAPTAGMVYKLVSVDGLPVAKRSANKQSAGGRKYAYRTVKPTGTLVEEIRGLSPEFPDDAVPVQFPLLRGGEIVHDEPLSAARDRARAALGSLPWEGLALAHGEPALETRERG